MIRLTILFYKKGLILWSHLSRVRTISCKRTCVCSKMTSNFNNKNCPKLNVNRVNWATDFRTQVDYIMQEIRMTEDQKYEVNIIKENLERAIHSVWADATISVYGSVVSGLGQSCSDIDYSVDTTILKNTIWPTTSHLTIIKEALLNIEDFSHLEEKTYPIPYLSIVYTPSKRNIKVTFNNERAKAFTPLISAIIKIDERIYLLTMLVKYWCKVHGMIGHKKLTSFGIYMLVIFYLQQEGIIPSVASMLEQINRNKIDGFNVATKDKIHFEKKEIRHSLLQLLGGFFEYYSKFKWYDNVVCCFGGTLYNKAQFQKNRCYDSLPEKFCEYKSHVINNPSLVHNSAYMYVQNALFLTQNLTADLGLTFVNYFKIKISYAALCYDDACRRDNNNEFLKRLLVRSAERFQCLW